MWINSINFNDNFNENCLRQLEFELMSMFLRYCQLIYHRFFGEIINE